MDNPLVFVALPLMGALVAIAWHQLSLGRTERVFYRAAAWSLWAAAVVGVYWRIHDSHGDTRVVVVSQLFYTLVAAGLPIALSLVRNLYGGPVEPRVMRRWYALAAAVALAPALTHLVLPARIVHVNDALSGPMQFSTVGPLGGLLAFALGLPVLWQMRTWLRAGPTRSPRIRAARVFLPVFILIVVNDLLVIAAGSPSTILFPLFTAVQAIALHGMLLSESVGAMRDLEVSVATRTEQVETQRNELHRAFENLRTVMTGLPDGVLAIDEDAIVFANTAAAQLVGQNPAELVGSRIDRWFRSERLRELAQEAIASSQRVGPLELQLGEGALAIEADALGIEFGGRRTALVILRDVSERARMREQLLRSDRLASLGTLIAGVAHEINNPLSYVLGNLEALADADPAAAGADHRAALQEATEGALRIRGIVESMRSFARPATANIADVDLRDVARDAIKLTRNTIEHQAQLEVRLGDIPTTLADRAQLGQVAVNLIVNAIQACRESSGKIEVITRTSATGEARLEIRDNGIGMSEAVRARAFDPFYTTKTVGSGTGLGLSICHGIATAFGGRVELDSTEGQGTVASLVMPSSRIEAKVAAAVPRSTQLAAVAVRARVLIIDDDPSVARALRRILRDSEVHVAHDRAQVEAALALGPYDLVLCDLMMPGLTGIELFEQMERDAPEVAERMVFMTGGAFTSDAVAFVERMGDRCLLKPIRAVALRELVVNAVQRGRDDHAN